MSDNMGNLAYCETLFNGLIPCKALLVRNDGYIALKITATRKAYKKGEIIYSRPDTVIPRAMVHIRNGKYIIRTGYKWINEDGKAYAVKAES